MNRRKDRKGSALIVAVVFVLIVAGFSVAMYTQIIWQQKESQTAIDMDELMSVCEAGLERARYDLFQYRTDATKGLTWDDILSHCDGVDVDPLVLKKVIFQTDAQGHYIDTYTQEFESKLADYESMLYGGYYGSSTNPKFLAPTSPSEPTFAFANMLPYDEGAYFVTVYDNEEYSPGVPNPNEDGNPLTDADDMLFAVVTSFRSDGSFHQVEALLEFWDNWWVPDHGVTTRNDLEINGSVIIDGPKGKTYSGGDTNLVGTSLWIEQAVEAVGTVSGSPKILPVQGINSGVPENPIPELDPADFRQHADYVLKDDGTGNIYANDGITILGTAGSGDFKDFNYKKGSWDVAGSVGNPDGTYYVEGSIKITGSGTQPQRVMTIIAEGSISTMGNPNMIADKDMEGTLMITGTDLDLSGTPGAQYGDSTSLEPALLYAREQVNLSGNVDIYGAVICYDAEDLDKTVSTKANVAVDIGGSPHVYGVMNATMIQNPWSSVRIAAIRKLR